MFQCLRIETFTLICRHLSSESRKTLTSETLLFPVVGIAVSVIISYISSVFVFDYLNNNLLISFDNVSH